MPKLVLFSAVEGRLLLKGQPLAKVKVVQRWQWLGEDGGTVENVTDAKGRFRFAEVTTSRARAPKDVLLIQDLETTHEGKTVSLWNLTREELTPNGELGGHPIVLTAELTAQARETKLPVSADKRSIISGLATFEHPYLDRLEQVQVTPAGIGRALKDFLSSKEGAKGLAAFFPAIGASRHSVAKILKVSEVRLTEGALYDQKKQYALEGAPRFFGATTHAQVTVELDSQEQVTAGFFAWALFVPLDESGTPRWEAHFADRWEVDTREWIREQATRQLANDRVAKLVRKHLQASPGSELQQAVGAKKFTVEALEVDSVQLDGVKDDWAVLNALVRATLNVGARREHPRLRAFVTVQLASLGSADYRLAQGKDGPHFRPFRFGVTLTTDRPSYAQGEPILLNFEVENLMGTPQQFLEWHTPFEGFCNDFLDVRPVDGSEPVDYHGPLMSRAPPGPEDYRPLGPGEKARVSIDLTQAYPVKRPGQYVVKYKGLDPVWAGEARFTLTKR